MARKAQRMGMEQEWINHPGKPALARANRMFLHNDTRQQNILNNMENKPEIIPTPRVSHVYGKEKKQWVLVGYKCLDCGKAMAKLSTVEQHPLICDKNLKINRETEGDFMPIQRIEKNGETYYRWGTHGKLYKNRVDAEKQAQAAHASGYQEPVNNYKGRPQTSPKVKK